jgi:hypothetical protein
MTTRSWIRNLFASRTTRANRRAPARCRPSLEALEDRRVLSGTVTAEFNASGVLIIQGDSRSNQIVVHLERTVGYTITGTDTAVVSSAPGATLVPGGVFIPPPSGPLTPGNVIMKGGDDIVTICGDFAFHDFSVDTGNGDDQVFADGFYGFGTLSIRTGNGDDRVTYTAETFQLHSSVDTGNGNDVVVLDGFVPFQGTHTITTGNGNDCVEIGGGTDMFQGALNVLTGNGDDTVAVCGLGSFITNLNFDGGRGTDALTGRNTIEASGSTLSNFNFECVT